MSVAIRLVRAPNWEEILCHNGLGGNKDIFRKLVELPKEIPTNSDPELYILRPTDFVVWRAFFVTLSNSEVFLDLLQQLELDSSLWLEFSY
jgi:hypothetical protein